MPRVLRSLPVLCLIIGCLSTLLVLGLRQVGLLEPIELLLYDHHLRSLSGPATTHSRLSLLTITEEDILSQGRWPITDAVLTEALDRLLARAPLAIGLDIYRDIPVPPGREALNARLLDHPNIIAVTKLGGGGSTEILPPPVLAGSEQVGFNDIFIDRDGIVRRALLFQDVGQNVEQNVGQEDASDVAYAFGLRLALLALAREGVYPEPDPFHPDFLRLGSVTLPPFEPNDGGYVGADAGGYQILLDFRNADRPFDQFSLSHLLAGRVDPALITDRIVLVGVTTESVPDLFHTPRSSGLTEGPLMHGVTLHAAIVDQLLRAGLQGQSPMLTTSDPQEFGWILLWGLGGGLVGILARSAWRASLLVLAAFLLLDLVAAWCFQRGLWIPEVPPALSWLLAVGLVNATVLHQARRDRAVLMHLFSQHVSDEVADVLWQQRDQVLHEGRPRSQELVATVLFVDFKGYSLVSEDLSPSALMAWVNAYLSAMTEIILNHHGVIDDYAGDAIKSNFGVPLKRIGEAEVKQDAIRAVTCALVMEEELHRLNAVHERQGFPTVGLRAGIYTGPVVAGVVGSRRRLKYTTVGDTVNMAARLETWDREWVPEEAGRRPSRILIGESTARYVSEAFRLEPVGDLTVKGRSRPMVAYRVLGPK